MAKPKRARRGALGTAAPAVQEAPAAAPAGVTPAVGTAILLLAIGIAGRLGAHLSLFFPSWTDENVHLYVARRISEGATLYRDIDSARPPLVILPLAALIRVGLAPLLAARVLVFLAALATSCVTFLGAQALFSRRAAVLATAFYLLSPELIARLPYTGIQLVQLGATLCLVLTLLGRPLGAGAAFGLALGAGQHSLVIGGLAGIWFLVRDRRQALWFVVGVAGAFAAVFGLAWLLGAQHLWENLVARHLYHLSGGGGGTTGLGPLLLAWIGDNLLLFALAGGTLLTRTPRAPAGSPARSERAARAVAAALAMHLAVLLLMSAGHFLYAVPVFPLVCLLAGRGGDQLGTWLWRPAAGAGQRGRLIATGALGAVAISMVGWKVAQSQQQGNGEALAFLPYPRLAQMARMQRLDVCALIAKDIDRRLPAAATVFGHGPVAAQVALDGGRRVAGELADLAPRWIEEGTVSRRSVITGIENDAVGALVTPAWLLVQDPEFRAYLDRCYRRPQVYPRPRTGDGRGVPDLLLFWRNDLPRP